MTCEITGVLRNLAGEALPFATLLVARRSDVEGGDGAVIIPNLVEVVADASGAFTFDAYPGAYEGRIIGANGAAGPFPFGVPDGTATADLADLVARAGGQITPALVQQALTARDDAVAAAEAVGEANWFSVDAYGAAGDGASDDAPAILAALTAAAGRPLVGRAGAVYRFASAVDFTGSADLDLSMSRWICDVPNVRPITVRAPGVIGPYVLTSDYLDGAMELRVAAMPAAPKAGSRIHISTNARDPGNRDEGSNAAQYRVGEQAFVGEGSTTTVIRLATPLRFLRGIHPTSTAGDEAEVAPYTTAMGARVVLLPDESYCRIKLGRGGFSEGHDSDPSPIWRSGAVAVYGFKAPEVTLEVDRGYGPAVTLAGTYGALVDQPVFGRLEDDTTQSQFGYGVLDKGWATQVRGMRSHDVRHAYTTGADSIGLSSTDKWALIGVGRIVGGLVEGGHATGGVAAPYDTHACAEDVTFVDCSAEGVAAAPFGLRGRNIHVVRPKVRSSSGGVLAFTEYDNNDPDDDIYNNGKTAADFTSVVIDSPDIECTGDAIVASAASVEVVGRGRIRSASHRFITLNGGAVTVYNHQSLVAVGGAAPNATACITVTPAAAAALAAFPTSTVTLNRGAALDIDARGSTSTLPDLISAASGTKVLVEGLLRARMPNIIGMALARVECSGPGVIEYSLANSVTIADLALTGLPVRLKDITTGEQFDGTGDTDFYHGYTKRLAVTAAGVEMAGPPKINGVPLMISPEMFDSTSDGVADDTDAFEAAWQAAIDEGVPFVVRRPHLLTRQMALEVNGAVLFDWQGGRIQAAGDYGEGDNLLYLTPGSASGVAFEGVGGDIDISGMPPGMFTTNDAFNLSPGFDLTRIRWHGYRMYSGPAWKQSGADSHIFAVADDIDLDGIHIGAYDAAIYASSGSNGSGARKSGLRVRGRFIGCQYGVTAKRTFRDLDIIVNAVNCLGAVGSGTAQVDGSTVLGSENGVIIVNARNCEWPLIHRWGDKVTCIVNSVDGGAYYAESSPGAGDGYASVEHSAARLVGSKRNYVTINAHGINPLCTSLSTTNRSNARAVEFEAGNGESTHNRVEIHCSGLGRVMFEQDASDYNIVTHSSTDMSDANVIVGANSRAYSVGHDNARSGTVTAPGMAFSSDPNTGFYRPGADQIGMATGGVERVLLTSTALTVDVPATITGDVLVSNGNLRVTKVNNSGTTPATVSVRDGDASVAGGQPIGRYDWISNVSGVEQVAAYIEARARNTTGRSSLFFSAGYAGSLADVMELRDDALLVAVAATLAAGLTVSGGTVTLPSGSVAKAALANGAGLSVLGRASNAAGALDDIAAGTDHQVLRRSGTALAFGALSLAQADATTGELPINRGGTGGATAPDARTNLGLGNAAVATVTTDASDTTAGRLLAVGAGAAQLDATLFRRGNILGTVAQLAGVPTNALIEANSNANGFYMRLADGWQVCWQATTITATIATAFLGGFRSSTTAWTFPAAFISAPAVDGSFANYTSMPALIGTVSATSAGWAANAVTSQGSASRDVILTAVGKWF